MNNAFSDQEAGGKLGIVSRRTHRDGECTATNAYFERFFANDSVRVSFQLGTEAVADNFNGGRCRGSTRARVSFRPRIRKGGRGQPHSKTYRNLGGWTPSRSVMECGCP